MLMLTLISMLILIELYDPGLRVELPEHRWGWGKTQGEKKNNILEHTYLTVRYLILIYLA